MFVAQHYKNSRQSPAHPPQQPSPQQAFGTPYQARGPTGPYIEPLTPMSSRQIIMNDFITSQQMHGQSRGRSDKESPSPRSASVSGSPAAIYYAEKDQRQRAEFLSRASPAEHINRYALQIQWKMRLNGKTNGKFCISAHPALIERHHHNGRA